MKIKPLAWRKPTNTGADLGLEDAVAVADGIGGKYSITPSQGEYLLWCAHDEFIWESHKTIVAAKSAAEAHWQKSAQAVIS